MGRPVTDSLSLSRIVILLLISYVQVENSELTEEAEMEAYHAKRVNLLLDPAFYKEAIT